MYIVHMWHLEEDGDIFSKYLGKRNPTIEEFLIWNKSEPVKTVKIEKFF